MLYQICPRCHFRLQATKHICSTCGQTLQPKKPESNDAESQSDVTQPAEEKSTARSFWKSLFSTT